MKKLIHICLLILWLFVIFSFSNENGEQSSSRSDSIAISIVGEKAYYPVTRIVRKGAHLSEFAILTVLTYLTVSDYFSKNKYMITLLFSVLVSALDEFHQIFIVNRTGTFVDVAIDSLAIFITVSIILIKTKKDV